MKHHRLLREDPKGEAPQTQREVDEVLAAQIRRVKGPEAVDAIAQILRASRGHQTGSCFAPLTGVYAATPIRV